MHVRLVEAGDHHADLWEELDIQNRFVAYPVDVTLGEHPELGLCVVSHYALEDVIEWHTSRPISVPATG